MNIYETAFHFLKKSHYSRKFFRAWGITRISENHKITWNLRSRVHIAQFNENFVFYASAMCNYCRFFAIKTWFSEERLFKYGSDKQNDLSKVGHYTQMVWATSHTVGCGWAACNGTRGPKGYPYFTYVCNYCPA